MKRGLRVAMVALGECVRSGPQPAALPPRSQRRCPGRAAGCGVGCRVLGAARPPLSGQERPLLPSQASRALGRPQTPLEAAGPQSRSPVLPVEEGAADLGGATPLEPSRTTNLTP